MATYLPYSLTTAGQQTSLGHYAVAQKSGNLTGWSANANIGSIRWAPTNTNALLVLMRLKAAFVTQATATAGVFDLVATVNRLFTSDFTTNSTAINMSTVSKTNTMRSTPMNNSLMGANGPRICTTAGMTTFTATPDNAAFGYFVANVTGTTVGIATSATLYEWTGIGQHPIVLSNNEGIIVTAPTASAGGTFNVYLQWEWAEVLAV